MSPESGEVGVPTDVEVTVFYERGTAWLFVTFVRADDGAEVAFEVGTLSAGDSWRAVIQPDLPLDPDTEYEVTIRGQFQLEPVVVLFTTDDAPEEPPPVPTLALGAYFAEPSGCGSSHYLDMRVMGARHVEVEASSAEGTLPAYHSLSEDVRLGKDGCTFYAGSLPYDEALTLRARGVGLNGDVSGWSEPVTFEVPAEPCGCATTTPSLWAFLPVLLLVRRRPPA